jgi:hypothetical protein
VNSESNRPPGHDGKRERDLSHVAKDLGQAIIRAYGSLNHNTLCLSGSKLEELSNVLVEFAEDIHNEIGIWKSLERYNREFFGTPLPFVLQSNEDVGSETINKNRIQHLLWILYSELTPELLLSPTHLDLKKLAVVIAKFLEKRFKDIPRGSSVKEFLAQPNQFGWEVKKKLIWLGTHSYLFRNSFKNYVQDHGGKTEIPVVDDFVSEYVTDWSGLGVPDILAAILDISEEQRSTLRSWYERHNAYYRILVADGQKSQVMNLINGKVYAVRHYDAKDPFKVGEVVLGFLVSWDGEWYWSGSQYIYGNTERELTEEDIQKLKEIFHKERPLAAYIYRPEFAEKARQAVSHQSNEFIKYHGSDLVIYPNGISMAADRQKEIRLQWESKGKEVIERGIREHKLKGSIADMSYPHDLLESENGVGIYFNPDEGEEIMTGFHNIISGFKKKGIDLKKVEEEGIMSFIKSNSISPKFVRRLIQEYGYESIESAFLIRNEHNESHIDYLLRRFKGAYYRNRYPRITLI